MEPTPMPIMGDHRRIHDGPRRISTPTTIIVTLTATIAATLSVPSGMSLKDSKMIVMTVAAMSIITVPVTTGVKIRRSSESRPASRN